MIEFYPKNLYLNLKIVVFTGSLLFNLILITINPTHAQTPEPLLPPMPRPGSNLPIPDIGEYTLGPGDLIEVNVLDVPEYSGEYLILNDGTMSLPLIGRMQAAGLTVLGLTDLISQKYAPYVQQTSVAVSIVSPRPITIAVAGEVNRPGSYIIPLIVPETQARQFQFYKVTQLLQQAGGVTQVGDISQIEIRRVSPTQQVFTINLRELIEEGDLSQDVVLRDGDRIIVPIAPTLDPTAVRQITSASFAPETIDPFPVVIVGEVFQPGTHMVGEDPVASGEPPKLTEAITLAGGITPLADIREIQLRRLTTKGEEQIITVDLWELLIEGDANQDIALQTGDSIIIPQAKEIDPEEVAALADASFSREEMQVSVVGEVMVPGLMEVPLDTTLNKAILAAGGFDQSRAHRNTVELVRLNPNGTVSRREITLDWQADINERNNPILRQDDVIVIRRSGLTQTGDKLEEVFRPWNGLIGVSNLINTIRMLAE
ncbi:MAG: polysaccharide biosynthesis/export family protein [Microcoleaceae cyanobacterium]